MLGCITLGLGLESGWTVALLAWLASMELDDGWCHHGGGWQGTRRMGVYPQRWERLARTVGVDLLTLARLETIHPRSDNVVNFCLKYASEQKTQEGRPLPKRTDCACKKTQDLMHQPVAIASKCCK